MDFYYTIQKTKVLPPPLYFPDVKRRTIYPSCILPHPVNKASQNLRFPKLVASIDIFCWSEHSFCPVACLDIFCSGPTLYGDVVDLNIPLWIDFLPEDKSCIFYSGSNLRYLLLFQREALLTVKPLSSICELSENFHQNCLI